MALANIARWFYERGLHVLMVDWDLEAPGLEAFFESPTEPGQDTASLPDSAARLDIKGKPGVVDMLLQYKRVHPRLPLPAKPRPPLESALPPQPDAPPPEALAVLREHLSPIKGMLHPIFPPQTDHTGSLWLLPAGLRVPCSRSIEPISTTHSTGKPTSTGCANNSKPLQT
jgi:hypothetical protein